MFSKCFNVLESVPKWSRSCPKFVWNLSQTHYESAPNPSQTSKNEICSFQNKYSEARLTLFSSLKTFKTSKRLIKLQCFKSNLVWNVLESVGVANSSPKPAPHSSGICLPIANLPRTHDELMSNPSQRPKMRNAVHISKISNPRQG